MISLNSKFYENLEVLISMVQSLTITDKTLIKEEKIIAEEIDMYFENPSSRGFYELNALMYNSAYKYEIAGMKEDIKDLSVDYFEEIFNYYYSPSNCQLFIAGPINVVELKEKLQSLQNINIQKTVEREQIVEVIEQEKKEKIIKMNNIESTLNYGGYKLPQIIDLKEQVISYLMFEVLEKLNFSLNNKRYKSAINNGIINDTFYLYNYITKDINAIIWKVSGKIDLTKINKFIEAQLELHESDLELIDKCLKGLIGAEVRLYETSKKIVSNISAIVSLDIEFEEFYQILLQISAEDILNYNKEFNLLNNYYVMIKSRDVE